MWAEWNGLQSPGIEVEVVRGATPPGPPGEPVAVELFKPPGVLKPGTRRRLEARIVDAEGRRGPAPDFQWTLRFPDREARWTGESVVLEADTPGVIDVEVALGALRARGRVLVREDLPLAVVLDRATERIGTRAVLPVLATAVYGDGEVGLLDEDVAWTTSDPEILTIDDQGMARG